MSLLKIHLTALVIMLGLIVFFLHLSNKAPSSTLVSSEKKKELNVKEKSLENYLRVTFPNGSVSIISSQIY
ncbi:MAG: hypothetical protein M3R36_11150 [Bacteroidota bacterium]|nr:hypothetical protein [Bacteroidota bacterium]